MSEAKKKFYCHVYLAGDAEPRTFVGFVDEYAGGVEELLRGVRHRFGLSQDKVFAVECEGKTVKSMEQLKHKADVIVREAVVTGGDAVRKAAMERLKKEGNGLWVAGKPAEAILAYGKALELAADATDESVLRCNRALAFLKLELWEDAVNDARTASTLDPSVRGSDFSLVIPTPLFVFSHFVHTTRTSKRGSVGARVFSDWNATQKRSVCYPIHWIWRISRNSRLRRLDS